MASWNVLNLFDTKDDPGKSDEEFTPEGRMKWTERKLEKKLSDLASVISEVDADIWCLSEIENIDVMRLLSKRTKLSHAYLVERDDERGIDVGLLSKRPLSNIRNTGYLRGTIRGEHKGLTFGCVHWKSKRGGVVKTGRIRKQQANEVNQLEQDLIVMGDFNEDPDEEGRAFLENIYQLLTPRTCTSHFSKKYKSCIDGAYLRVSKCSVRSKKARIAWPKNLVANGQPRRSISDHLPVVVDLEFSCPEE